jgi:hypothetical protein
LAEDVRAALELAEKLVVEIVAVVQSSRWETSEIDNAKRWAQPD